MSKIHDRKKKILLLTAGNIDHPSSRTRATQFIPQLQTENYEITWIPRVPVEPLGKSGRFWFPVFKRYYYFKTRLLLLTGKWDLVFVQRAYLEESYLKLLAAKKTPLVYDFDDALYLQENDKKYGISGTALMIKYADAVIVSTPYLETFCEKEGKKPFIIPTAVDGDIIKPEPNREVSDPPVIGWVGSKTTTVVIKEAEEGLRLLAKKQRYKLLMVGADNNYWPEGIPFEHRPWSIEKEPEHLKMMEIGIMPLLLTEYSKAKGGYKLYLYMAAGIPVVATPIGINTEIVKDGINGYLASTPAEWEKYLSELLENQDLRKKMGSAGRALFEEFYSTKMVFRSLNLVISNLINK